MMPGDLESLGFVLLAAGDDSTDSESDSESDSDGAEEGAVTEAAAQEDSGGLFGFMPEMSMP